MREIVESAKELHVVSFRLCLAWPAACVLAIALVLLGRADLAQAADATIIALRRQHMDTTSAPPATASAAGAAPERRLKLVQFPTAPTDADLKELTDSGARIVHYIPHNAYLVWVGSEPVARAARQLAANQSKLRYYGDLDPRDALAPSLDTTLNKSTPVAVTVQLFHHGAEVWQDVARVEALADSVLAAPVQTVHDTYVNLRLNVRGDRLAAIAAMDAVVNVEPFIKPKLYDERQGQIVAGNVSGAPLSPVGSDYLAWLGGHTFSSDAGNYPIVVVVDDGVDNGSTNPVNSEFRELNGPGAASRLLFSVTPPGAGTSDASGPDGHGNINASIVGGYNASTGAAFEDASGFNYGLGISPYGRLANVRIFSPGFDVGLGNASMVSDYYSRGARLSTNSWGADVAGAYDSFSQEYDALTRDAHGTTPGNQELLFLFAAGNAGSGAGTTGSPGTAKNVLTVGASETSNPDAAAGDGCGLGGASGNDARDMAGFSSRGPCSDGRVKPDIVAPGTFIQGAASLPTFNGSGVCGAATNDGNLPGTDALFPPGSTYTWSSGTSHSTPGVAGVASLVHEFLPRVYGLGTPSPALTKAFILHSGRHLTGSGANENLPGNNQGFGLVDMGIGFRTVAPRFFHDQETVLASSGQSVSFSGGIADASEPVRVALVWTDAPGSTIGAAYVNNLDLEIDINGTVYRGNNFVLGVSQPGGSADPRNNAEGVFLPSGNSGAMTITVRATTIGGDGVPGNGDSTDQDFAIVAYNFTTVVSAGTVRLDQSAYTCTDTVEVVVSDSDLTGSGTVLVDVTTSTGDAESISLSETPAGSGIFSAAVSVNPGSVNVGNGTLEVAPGATITATYEDADDGSGNPATVQDSSSVDCTAPQTSGVNTTNLTGTAATVDLATDEIANVVVRYGTSCASLTQSQAGGAATAHQIQLSGLMPLTTYFFAIDATDLAGNLSTDNNGGACYSFTTLERADFFTEVFAGDNDLDHQTLILRPDGSSDFYAACRTMAAAFPTDPSGGTPLNLADDASMQVSLAAGAQVSVYGVGYGSFFIGSNGYLTFGSGDSNLLSTPSAHFALPRVAALMDDLDPSAGGTVSWKQLSDRVAVTFSNVPEYGSSNSNSFQIELFFDGVLRITHLSIDDISALAGISAGQGIPADFQESDLSAYGPCSAGMLMLDAAAYACSGTVALQLVDADLTGAGSTSVLLSTSGGDTESVLLSESPVSSGIFAGSISSSAMAASPGNGNLDLSHATTTTATYEDADDGSGNSATVVDTATTDCLAPQITNVGTSVLGAQANVTFDTSELATGQVRYGTSCAILAQVQAAPGAATIHDVALAGLLPLTTYFFAVDAVDALGNSATDDNGGACYSFATGEQIDFFTELFSSLDNDLGYQTLTFTPDGSGSFYSLCRSGSTSFPTSPLAAAAIPLADDDSVEIGLSNGAQVTLYGQAYSSIHVGSNGYLTFGASDNGFQESLVAHFAQPRVAGLFDDLNPAAGGTVSWQQLSDRVAVTFQDVSQYGTTNSNNFQVELFFDGTIRITHLSLDDPGGLAGLSAGQGVPSSFQESDLSAYATCSIGCPEQPQTGCFAAAGSSLSLTRDPGDGSRNKLKWKWAKGLSALTLGELGDPVNGSTDYRLCVYDESASVPVLKLNALVESGGTCPLRACWRAQGTTGWKYGNSAGNGTGVSRLTLKGGEVGRPSVQLAGKGANLALPEPHSASDYFQQDGQVIVQLQSTSSSSCWQALFAVTDTKKNEGNEFKALIR